MKRTLNFYVTIFLIAAFLVSYFLSYFFITQKYEQIIFDELKNSARMLAQQIVLTRKWVSLHSAVLVEKNSGVEPNPFLSEPYVIDKKGRIYVKMNPAFVTRELSKLAERERGFYFRVTSLKAVNQQNRPDDFEKDALTKFETKGQLKEYYSLQNKSFRYIIPLYTEESCLGCHKDYKVGDVRGGLSIFLPAEELLDSLEKTKTTFFLITTIFHIAIFAGFLLFFRISVLNPIKRLTSFAMGENNSEGKDWINSFEFALLSEKLKEAKQKDEELKEKLTQEVKKATMELKEINDKKTEFMLEIGHKLKTPLTVINTSVDYLMMKGSCKEDEKFLTILKKNVEGLRRAVEQIFKTAQIDLGIFEERFEKLNLSELLCEVVSSFNISCQQLYIEKGLYIQGDKEKLIALFENLIHNAVKFNREGGKISITLCKQNGFATFSVKDEGEGIPTEERERIFDKFYHRDREGKEKGTGLGLYIAKRVVELHGGEIGFDTKVGEGTTFIVKLPLISERGKDSYGKEATNH